MKTTASKGIKTGRSLNNYEQNVLLPILTQGLELKKGKENAVTSYEMLDALSKCKIAVNKRSIERVIKQIRINNLIKGLMATHNEYFIANSKEIARR